MILLKNGTSLQIYESMSGIKAVIGLQENEGSRQNFIAKEGVYNYNQRTFSAPYIQFTGPFCLEDKHFDILGSANDFQLNFSKEKPFFTAKSFTAQAESHDQSTIFN
jgi:hypothetical protein